MASESNYYIPENSWMPVLTAASLGAMALGAGLAVQGKTPLFSAGGAVCARVRAVQLVQYRYSGKYARPDQRASETVIHHGDGLVHFL